MLSNYIHIFKPTLWAGEMALQWRAQTAPAEDTCSVQASLSCGPQPPVTQLQVVQPQRSLWVKSPGATDSSGFTHLATELQESFFPLLYIV